MAHHQGGLPGGGGGGGLPPLGPQGERLSEALGASQTLSSDSLQRPGLELRPTVEVSVYQAQVEDLKHQNAFLEDQLQRALKELKAYQIKFPGAHAAVRKEADELPAVPAWNTSRASMAPLLAAYDLRLEELDSLKDSQSQQIESLAARVELLVSENEELRSQHMAGLEGALGPDGRLCSSLSDVEVKEKMAELKERADILLAENQLMIEQTHMTTRELEQASSQLEERDKQVQELLHSLREAGSTVESLEGEVSRLKDEKDKAEAQLLQRLAELSRVTAALEEHQAALQTSQGQVSALTTKLDESKAAIQSLSERLEGETEALSDKYQACSKRIRELQTALAGKTQECDGSEEKARRLARELEATRLDAEGMLKVMSGMQKQLDEFAAREQEVERLSRESREQVEDALVERDQAKAREVQARREVARLLEARRAEAEKRADEVQAAVSAGKARLLEQYEAREEEIKGALAEAARGRAELEKAQREKRSAEALYSELCHMLKEEQAGMRARFNDLQQRVVQLELEKEALASRAAEASKELTTIRLDATTREERWAAQRKQLEEQVKVREREIGNVRDMHRRAELEHEAKVRDMGRLQRRLEEADTVWEGRLQGLKQTHKEQMESLSIKLLKAETALQDQEGALAQLQERQSRLLDKVKAEKRAALEQLDRQLRDEREMVQRVNIRNQELSTRLAAVAADKGELEAELEQAREEADRLEDDLHDNARKVSELSAQLSDSLSSQQALAKDEARLRAELARAQLELARLTGGGRTNNSPTRLLGSHHHQASATAATALRD